MKKKSIKKRLAAFGLGLMLSVSLISPFYVFADPIANVVNATTSYGSYTRGTYNLNLVFTSAYGYAIDYNFNGEYNGRMTFNFGSSINNSSEMIIPTNCYIESFSNNGASVTIAFKGQSYIGFMIVGTAAGSLQFNSITGYDMTQLTTSTATQLNTMNNYLNTISTKITSIDNNTSSINTLTGSINTSVDYIESDIDTMNTNLATIKSQLQSYFSTNNGTTVTIGDINLSLNYIDSLLDAQLTLQGNIMTGLNQVISAINNIDNQIDNITWNNITLSDNVSYSSDGINYDLTTGSHPGNTYYKVGSFPLNNLLNGQHKLFKVELNVGNFYRVYPNEFQFYLINSSNNLNQIYPDNLYIQYNRYSIIFYFTLYDGENLGGPWGNNVNLVIKSTRASNLYNNNGYIYYIDGNDIEYWQLLNCIKTFNQYNNQNNYYSNSSTQLSNILNAINNLDLSVNIDQQTQQEINEYNTTLNNVDITIDAELNPLRNNSQQILDSVSNFPTIIMTPADRFYNFMKSIVFNNLNGLNLNAFMTKYLMFLLFVILVGVMLG